MCPQSTLRRLPLKVIFLVIHLNPFPVLNESFCPAIKRQVPLVCNCLRVPISEKAIVIRDRRSHYDGQSES